LVETDIAVATAYDWHDVELGHGFYETALGSRFMIKPAAREEILHRLLELNHQRYTEEVVQGLHEKGTSKGKAGTAAKRRKKAPNTSPLLEGA
jgi:hypothetical protein